MPILPTRCVLTDFDLLLRSNLTSYTSTNYLWSHPSLNIYSVAPYSRRIIIFYTRSEHGIIPMFVLDAIDDPLITNWVYLDLHIFTTKTIIY